MCASFNSYTGEKRVDTDLNISDLQIDRLLKGPFTDRQGNFNYREWVKVLRINVEEDQPES